MNNEFLTKLSKKPQEVITLYIYKIHNDDVIYCVSFSNERRANVSNLLIATIGPGAVAGRRAAIVLIHVQDAGVDIHVLEVEHAQHGKQSLKR